MNDRHTVLSETWHFLTGEFALYHQRRWRKCLIQVIETESHVAGAYQKESWSVPGTGLVVVDSVRGGL